MNKIERQMQLEADAVTEGVARYYRRTEQDLVHSRPITDLLKRTIEPLADAIRSRQVTMLNTPRRLPKAALPLLSLSPEKLAFITLQTLFNLIACKGAAGSPVSITHAALTIGKMCAVERQFDRLRGRDRKVVELILSRNKNKWNALRRAQKLVKGLDVEDWSQGNRHIYLGAELIKMAIEHTPIFECVKMVSSRGSNQRRAGLQHSSTTKHRVHLKTSATLRLTRKAQQWLDQHQAIYEAMAVPIHLPMIVPPRQWSDIRGGGYLTLSRTELVKCRNKKQRQVLEDSIRSGNLHAVLSAVNTLQETPWRINNRLYQIMLTAWQEGYAVGGLPQCHRQESGSALFRDAGAELPGRGAPQRPWDRRAGIKAVSDSMMMHMRFETCEKLVDEERFYFPYQLDYRGRAYPIPQVFNPQSDDIGRALLEFADGKLLGARGAYWLAVYLTKLFGYDKVSFDERVEWVKTHEVDIRDSAENPLHGRRFWEKADKPWCFLAACIEWVDYCANGSTYESHLPVALDGTCNGLQHLSAMGRDEVGGLATNLVPDNRPQDLYQQVADCVNIRLEADAKKGNAQARLWLTSGRIDRQVVKRATMTTPYGVTPHGIREQLIEDGFTAQLEDKWLLIT